MSCNVIRYRDDQRKCRNCYRGSYHEQDYTLDHLLFLFIVAIVPSVIAMRSVSGET